MCTIMIQLADISQHTYVHLHVGVYTVLRMHAMCASAHPQVLHAEAFQCCALKNASLI